MATARSSTIPGLVRPRLGPALTNEVYAPAPEIVELVCKHGMSASNALFDPGCSQFRVRGVDGLVPYRMAWGSVVAIGEPVCAREDSVTLARALTAAARRRGLATVYAVTSPWFANRMAEHGAAAIAFGSEVQLDPGADPTRGSKGRELRKKLNHAARAGLRAGEYDHENFASRFVEAELTRVAEEWLRNRRGPQVFLTGIRLFEAPAITRHFHVRYGDRYVGVLTAMRLETRDGYLLNQIVTTPDAPDGTSELLITHALATLGSEGCHFATFGAAPADSLGAMMNVSPWSERLARKVFDAAGEAFHLDARAHYRRKFQAANEEPAFLVFDPPRIRLRQVAALLRAFNVSLA